MYAISFEISAFLLSLLCFVYCLTAKRRQYIPPKGFANRMSNQHFQFLMMLGTNMISSISSVTGVYLTTLTGDGISFWQYFFHALYFIFHTTLSLAFGLYIVSVTRTNIKRNKVFYFLFFVPYIVAEILILTNQWTGWCFYMDAQSIYHRGPLMLLLYAFGAFYVVMGFVFFIRNMKVITRADSIAVGVFIIIATLGIVVQAVRSDWLVELFFEALACLVIMMVLEEKAGHIDAMTGLLNRFAFLDNARRLMSGNKSFDLVLVKALGIYGLSKRFNDRTADEFLLQFATYLSEHSHGSLVFSYRRGEFIALFNNTSESSKEFAKEVVGRFKSPWLLGGFEVSLDTALALVNVPNDVQDFGEFEDLMASMANYQPTQEGSYIIPNSEIRTMVESKAYEEALRQVLTEKKLAVYFQPIYSIKENRTVSAEALLRIPCEPFQYISPEIYIPIAEKTGIIKEIGLFVFEEVCKFLSDERAKNSSIQYVELNLSVYQFLYDDLVESFEALRKKYDVPSSTINLEITETGGALNKEEVLHTLERFRQLGYTLSLDDFGTGYSNFVRMLRCQFENIKIDKSILWNTYVDQNGAKTLKSLMSFIKNQGSSIVQEGVETKEQLDLIASCGCDYVQGFYFSQAIPDEEFFAYIAKEQC